MLFSEKSYSTPVYLINADSIAAAEPNAQHEFIVFWSLTELTQPQSRKSNFLGSFEKMIVSFKSSSGFTFSTTMLA